MDPVKWKSVVISISTYRALKALAVANHRTISGQLTYVLESYLKCRITPWGDDETRPDEVEVIPLDRFDVEQ
jgi:hypothetical protein